VYSPTRLLTENFLKEFNINTTFYNPHDLKTLEKAITKKTKLFLLKTQEAILLIFRIWGKLYQLQRRIKF
jgi:cystathionine beta-lyase